MLMASDPGPTPTTQPNPHHTVTTVPQTHPPTPFKWTSLLLHHWYRLALDPSFFCPDSGQSLGLPQRPTDTNKKWTPVAALYLMVHSNLVKAAFLPLGGTQCNLLWGDKLHRLNIALEATHNFRISFQDIATPEQPLFNLFPTADSSVLCASWAA
jgi:hypothetical protein